MLCSSAVTRAPVSVAAAMMAASSSGLMVCTSMTRASIPSPASASAASRQRLSMSPVPTRVTSPPARRTMARPISGA